MLNYVLRRVLHMIPTLFGVTLTVFLLFNVAGGDPAAQAAGRYATAAEIELKRAEMGLNKSLPAQYFDLVGQVLTLDFGRSWTSQQKISTMLFDGLGPTLSVTVPAVLMALLLTIPLALFIANRRNGILDKTTLAICLAMNSLSSLVYVLEGQYYLAYKWSLFPISGWDSSWDGRWQFTVLPSLIIVVLSLGVYTLFFRTVFLEEIHQDYVRTARSKGLAERVILLKHVLKNSLVPIITLVVLQVPFMIVGSVLIESFFGIPGLGGMMFSAVQNADFPVIRALTVMSAVFYMAFQLFSDVLYAVVDPKIRLDG